VPITVKLITLGAAAPSFLLFNPSLALERMPTTLSVTIGCDTGVCTTGYLGPFSSIA
jgi:hypothetical protein